jgi:hypothetical protein
MNTSGSSPELLVEWIEHPRGDGMGRALTLECKASGLTVVMDDPVAVRALIDELVRALSWLDEGVESAWT